MGGFGVQREFFSVEGGEIESALKNHLPPFIEGGIHTYFHKSVTA